MKLTEMQFDEGQPVEGYGPGFFRVGGAVHQGAILVAPGGARAWDGTAGALVALAGAVDVLLLGTGPEIAHAEPALRQDVEAAGLGLEVMNSPAACRTYNVLLGEGRRVALAVLPV